MNPYQAQQDRINQFLTTSLNRYTAQPQHSEPAYLAQAIRYTLLAGGKRIRPLLVYATAESLDCDQGSVDYLAAALEMIHAYSLIHDDLPAMDNDDLRRGQATCHIKFDEATAILAGDALQAMAFEVLSETPAPATIVMKLINNLARACGVNGMAGGQSLDLQAENKQISLAQLQHIHSAKTGALLVACVTMVSTLATPLTDTEKEAYHQFAEHFGIAFQIVDDILDVTADTAQLGKPAGSDENRYKSTYPSLLGLEQAQEIARHHIEQAKSQLAMTHRKNSALHALTDFILNRSY